MSIFEALKLALSGNIATKTIKDKNDKTHVELDPPLAFWNHYQTTYPQLGLIAKYI